MISIGASAGETLNEEPPGDAKGLQSDAVFTEYFPASGSAELMRRLLSPLANREIARVSANSHTTLREQAIDLSQETFAVYVPAAAPPQGYALLSFIAPWQKGHLPAGWASVMDKHGMIFVSASNSGNAENIFDRRIPLALLGAHNIMQRYPVDRDRVYIGGMSGGARVAMRVALAYPDLFHGALLNAGSDPIGTGEPVLPPADLFQRFQSSRLVYVTGSVDTWNIDNDISSRQSMNAWCVFGTITETMQRAGHETASPAALDHALGTLDARASADSGKLAACRDRIARQSAAKLQEVKDLVDRDKPGDAWRLLAKIDLHYGGLAAPQSVELAQRIGDRR
jgi:hypothetical protein